MSAIGEAGGGVDTLPRCRSASTLAGDLSLDHSASLHDRLRRDTAAVHDELERQLDLLNPGLSLARYVSVLRAFFGFYQPLEESLKLLLPAAPPLGFSPPNRTPLLVRDLRDLGYSADEIAELPHCKDTPPMTRLEHLAGALYVLEGANLGAKIITKGLEKNLSLQRGSGATFFAQGAYDSSNRWRLTLRWLAHVSLMQDICVIEIASSAREVFISLSRWTALSVQRVVR